MHKKTSAATRHRGCWQQMVSSSLKNNAAANSRNSQLSQARSLPIGARPRAVFCLENIVGLDCALLGSGRELFCNNAVDGAAE
jgi:hypothetical protein